MSGSPILSRRLVLAGLWLAGSAPVWSKPRVVDQGLGGTGATPNPEPEDRGIGGTGYSGVIQRFGSIVVNDRRIAYPRNVAVAIDGEAASASALRIGHLTRVVARTGADGVLRTRRIDVFSEVVGQVEQVSDGELRVLGQAVEPAGANPSPRRGARVAIYGLRRTDGVIVASRIEPRRGRTDRVAGVLERDADGRLAIADLVLLGVDPALEGRRIIAEGRAARGALKVSRVRVDDFAELADAPVLSIEAYAKRVGDMLLLGSGQRLQDRAALAAGDEEDRVVVDARRTQNGGLQVESVRAVEGAGPPGRDPGGPGSSPPRGPGRPGAPAGGPAAPPGPDAPSPGPAPGGSPAGQTGGPANAPPAPGPAPAGAAGPGGPKP
ncbi:MAG: hypothetical protein U1E62_25085 [Alsobacter sp.]